MNDRATFDQYADDYDANLAAALELSGEDRMFFARGRVEWFGRTVRALNFAAARARLRLRRGHHFAFAAR